MSTKGNGFGRADLDVEGRDDRRVQYALKSLASTGYLDCDGRRGPQGYKHTLVRESGEGRLGIPLRPSGEGEDGGDDGASDDPESEDPAQGGAAGEEEEGGSRESARNDIRAIESGALRGEDTIARSREEDQEDYFEGGEFADDEEVVDYIAELLSKQSWYRAETACDAGDVPEDYSLGTDPVARRLRYKVGIYEGRDWWSDYYGSPTPYTFTAKDLFEMGPADATEEDRSSGSWPSTPEELADRLKTVIPLLQAGKYRFWDPGYSDWLAERCIDHPLDMEKACKPTYLHAELWRNEHTGEELWALVALREGWRVPDEAIEEAVWRRDKFGYLKDELEMARTSEENAEFEF